MAYGSPELLTLERIAEISTGHGFRPDVAEQSLMDYLVHQRVAGVECTTKGGMCMPLYRPGGTLRRLSAGTTRRSIISESPVTIHMIPSMGSRGFGPRIFAV